MSQFLVILRGTPASGKTTIARSMRDFEKKIAWLKVDNFKDFFAEDSSIALEYVNGSAIATMNYLFNEGFSVVMDGVFQDTTTIADAVKVAKEKDIKYIVYEIQVSLEELLRRDKTRAGVKEGFRKPLEDKLIAKVYQTLKENPFPEAQPLDTEQMPVEECIKKIYNDLAYLK
jgi:chloramphenicol 3-O-phosphotransferase